jgi:hypothetical protein
MTPLMNHFQLFYTTKQHHIPMTDNNLDFDLDAFMKALRAANAEDLKNRIVTRTEEILKSHGINDSQLKHVDVDVSDYLRDDDGTKN